MYRRVLHRLLYIFIPHCGRLRTKEAVQLDQQVHRTNGLHTHHVHVHS